MENEIKDHHSCGNAMDEPSILNATHHGKHPATKGTIRILDREAGKHQNDEGDEHKYMLQPLIEIESYVFSAHCFLLR